MAYPNGSFGHDGSKIGGGYWPEFGGGTYCYGWGCDIGDGEWNFGDFAAIALGAGLIFAIAN